MKFYSKHETIFDKFGIMLFLYCLFCIVPYIFSLYMWRKSIFTTNLYNTYIWSLKNAKCKIDHIVQAKAFSKKTLSKVPSTFSRTFLKFSTGLMTKIIYIYIIYCFFLHVSDCHGYFSIYYF